MQFNMKNIGWLLSIILVLSLYSGLTTYKLITDKPKIISTTITIPGDVVYTAHTVYTPKPYSIIEHDTTYIPLDSAQCVADYKILYKQYTAVKHTRDTLQNDSSATIVVGTKISRNAIDSLGMSFKNNRVKSITTTTVTYSNKLPMISLGVIYDTKSIIPYASIRINPNLYLNGGYNITLKTPSMGLQYTIFSK